MAIPFEALLPYGIIFGLLTAGGGAMQVLHVYRNGGVRDRFAVDQWDTQMMERDLRLNGGQGRKQVDQAVAPEAFKHNHVWKSERPLI
ncbi:hypothetical protein CJU90_4343 [Yarrowia sp. C11]|nr:hypothetical protein CKK34_6626 [Yarrowia sp. E02]KAG5365275.1 hypothetical protein CJU90_4343 [Yarrowia sp. C11]